MEKTKRGAKTVLYLYWLLSFLYFVSYITRLSFSATMTEMISVGVLDKEQAGLVGSALFLTYALGQIVSGFLSDRFSPYGIVGMGLGITVVCNFLMSMVSDPVFMMILGGANGFAQALFWPPILGIMAKYLDGEQYARGILWVSAAAQVATVMIYVVVPVLLLWFDWRSAFLFAVAIALLFGVLWFVGYPTLRRRLTARDVSQATETTSSDMAMDTRGLIRTLAASGALVLLVPTILHGFLKDGIQAWMPTFFTEVFQMDSSLAILSNVLLPVFSFFTVMFATELYRRVFRDLAKEALVLFGVIAALCVLLGLFFEGSAVLCLILAALIMGCVHGVNLMFISYMPRFFRSTGRVSTVSGICNACTYIGSTLSSYGVAWIAARFGWQIALFSWGALALVGLVLCAVVAKRWTLFAEKGKNEKF